MRQLLQLAFVLLPFLSVYGQILEPIKWNFSSESLGGNEYQLKFTASIDKGWTIYSQYTDPDGGPVPTTVFYETEGGFELIGESEEQGHKKEGLDPYFDVNVVKFLDDEDFVITQRIKLTGGDLKLMGYVESMACDKSKCLPPTPVDFALDLKGDPSAIIATSVKKEVAAEKSTLASKDKNNEASTYNWIALPHEGEVVKYKVALVPTEQKDEYEIIFEGKVQKGWATYSYFSADGGPIPTTIEFEEPTTAKLNGEPIESGDKKEGPEPLFDNINVIKFTDKAPFTISQKIKVKDKTPLKGYLNYMACNNEKCTMPIYVDFHLNLDGTEVKMGQSDANETALAVAVGDSLDQVRPTIVETFKDPIGDCGDSEERDSSIFWMFVFGFGGGLLALLTPCVFPMIPITVSYFTKDSKRKGWVNGLIYGISIVVIYVVMGLGLTAIFGEEALNRLSTNWIANSLFFIIFIVFAFSFFGFFEITLPSSWSTKSDQMADKGGILGIFFMAFTLALVSFSCTGPIIGTAIVQAASNQVGPAVVMTGFALALAIPFGLFAIFPSWLNSLPRSGSWMSSVKVVLGFLELALALKFLSVADLTNHWGFLRYELFLGLWIVIAALMTMYLFGFIKFPHDSPIKKLSIKRKGFALASLVLTLFLCTGFMKSDVTKSYKSLKLLSGIAPPANYNFFLDQPEVNQDIKSRYSSYSKCANNIDCFKDYYEGLAYAREIKKPVFLDMTGYGCVNCRKTEEHIWVDDRIRDKLNNDFVMVSLYVDDDQKLDKKLVSKQRKKPIRNIGNKWADFQIVNFEQNSQPLYVMMSPQEEVLAPPRGFKDGIEDYNDFLECGLKTYSSN